MVSERVVNAEARNRFSIYNTSSLRNCLSCIVVQSHPQMLGTFTTLPLFDQYKSLDSTLRSVPSPTSYIHCDIGLRAHLLSAVCPDFGWLFAIGPHDTRGHRIARVTIA
jgi:hypothetical protein